MNPNPVEPEYILEQSEKTLHSTVQLRDTISNLQALIAEKLERLSLRQSMATSTLNEILVLRQELALSLEELL